MSQQTPQTNTYHHNDSDFLPEPGAAGWLTSQSPADVPHYQATATHPWGNPSPSAHSTPVQHSIPSSNRHPSQEAAASPHPSHPGSYYSYHGLYHSPNSHYSSFYHPGYHTAPAFTVNTTPTTTPVTTKTNKRKYGTASGPNKRRRKQPNESCTATDKENTPPVPTAAPQCGVGPSSIPLAINSADPFSSVASLGTSEPLLDHTPTTPLTPSVHRKEQQRPRQFRTTSATDVWYFLRALDTEEEPAILPDPATEPILESNPKKFPYVGCKLCKKWKTWSHGPGMTSCYRLHMQTHHLNVYEATIKEKQLKHSNNVHADGEVRSPRGPFCLRKFWELLRKFIAVNDQSMNVVECREFRELLLYIGDDTIDEDDIPSRHKITSMIEEALEDVREKIKVDLQASPFTFPLVSRLTSTQQAIGRVSYTTDLWSDPNLMSFMAITAHFYIRHNGRLELRTNLIAFRYVSGSHAGVNLAKSFFQIIDEYGVAHNIGQITMDNASNNNTMMEEVEQILRARNIPFDKDGNRIRCFPHIINLACQAIMAALKESPALEIDSATDPVIILYLSALEKDLIGMCRSIVNACRASGQRRQELEKIIREGNEKGSWAGELPNGDTELRVLQLLRDCETRWSSTYLMIDRMIYLYPAIRKFLLNIDQSDLNQYLLSSQQLNILRDIHQILEIPHAAQELLSAERTPTLSLSLPLYEIVIEKWQVLKVTIPELAPYIEVGIRKLEDYLREARKTRIYAHAMILNPSIKFTWMEKHWGHEATEEARGWIKESMLKYQKVLCEKLKSSQRYSTPLRAYSSTSSIAACSQASGFSRLTDINASIRRSASTSSVSPPSSHNTSPSQRPHEPTAEERAEQAVQDLLENHRIVDAELRRYEEAGILAPSERLSDLTREWERQEHTFPLLFRVAMDVLPVQASAVPCERVFSSSKETCSLRRSRLSPKHMEALQMLKFSYRQDRLSFTDDLLAKEEDYTISGTLTSAAVDELMRAERFLELGDLIENI